MHIIPTQSPCNVLIGTFIRFLGFFQIILIACCQVKPCTGPCQIIIKAAACVESVRSSVALIAFVLICKCIKALCML